MRPVNHSVTISPTKRVRGKFNLEVDFGERVSSDIWWECFRMSINGGARPNPNEIFPQDNEDRALLICRISTETEAAKLKSILEAHLSNK